MAESGIPKTIHYCWFGRNPLPKLAIKCIESWRKFLPDYEIKEWNEDNFDVMMIPYTAEAYKNKKYAFVSDYARFWILYHYGGLYFDTDVEIIKPMNDIIDKGPFMGCEKDAKDLNRWPDVNPGVGLGFPPEHSVIKELLDLYTNLIFSSENQGGSYKTIVDYTTEVLTGHGLVKVDGIQEVAGISIYPKEFFNPLEHVNQLHITDNTRSIHLFAGTWVSNKERMKKRIIQLLGSKMYGIILKMKKK